MCPVCLKAHTLHNCDEFKRKSLKEHHNLVQSASLCFGCLGKGHYSQDCPKRMTCQKCGKPHPTVLHYDPKDYKEQGDQAISYKFTRVVVQATFQVSLIIQSVNKLDDR